MVKNPHLLRKFEDSFVKERGKLSFNQAIRLFTFMWKEGVHLGVLPPKDPLEGIEVDIKIAKVVNSCLKRSLPE
jgi:hypothetical protein